MAEVILNTNTTFQSFAEATGYARSRGDAAEATRLAVLAQQQANNAQTAGILCRRTATSVATIGPDLGLYNITAGAAAGQVYERMSASVVERREGLEAASRDALRQLGPSVNAAYYGVAEGANVSTLMAAIAATPDGGTLVCPPGVPITLTHTGGRLIINNRRNLTILGNGLTIQATASLADTPQNGGVYLVNCAGVTIRDMLYDGRLDSRTPAGGDAADTNMKSGWNILSGCTNIRLERVTGYRCMMDGFYIGHADNTFTEFPGASVNQANMPKNTVLIGCVGDGNYRQGLSVVGCEGLTGSGNRFDNTGKTGGKFTLPAAGVDFEAFQDGGWFNRGIDLTDTEVNGNKGQGVLFENGTRGAVMRGVRGAGNGGGIVAAVTAEDCTALNVTLALSGTDPAEPINIVLRGTNNHIRGGTIACANGSQGAFIGPNGFLCGLHDLTITAASGATRTGTVHSEGGEAQLNNITVIDGRETLAGYAVLDVRGTGSRVVNPRLVAYSANASVPIKQTSGRQSGYSSDGYATAPVLSVPGSRLPLLTLGLAQQGNRAATVTPVSSTRDADLPDRSVYRVVADILSDNAAFPLGTVLGVTGAAGYSISILSCLAIDNSNGDARPAGPMSSGTQLAVSLPASVAVSLRIVVNVEVRRT